MAYHLGCAAEGETPDISGNEIDPGVGDSNVARVSVHQTLVMNLQPTSKNQPVVFRVQSAGGMKGFAL